MIIHRLPILCALCCLALVLGCRRNDRPESFDTDSVVVVNPVMADTLAPDTVVVKRVILKDPQAIIEAMKESPDRERYEKGILPTMAVEVPEYAGKLLANEEDGFIIVDKNTMKIYRYDRFGVEQERVGIAVAKNFGSKHKRRDGRTPEGYFTIEGIYDSTEWLFTDDDGNTSKVKGQFGPRYMRLRTPVSSQIGIHGTVAPWSIGGRRSHGCIRMLNENILRFAEICKPGWPVIVSPGPKDMAVNESEGYDIPSVTVIPGRPRCKPGKKISNPLEEPDSPMVDSASNVSDSHTSDEDHESETLPGLDEESNPTAAPEEPSDPPVEEAAPESDDPMFN